MALKLAEQIEKAIPGVVKAVVARRTDSLAHQSLSKSKNEEQITKASTMLKRIHDHE